MPSTVDLLLPQSENQARFAGATDLHTRIKPSNYFKYVTSARNCSFSSRKACVESVLTLHGGAG